MDTAHTVRGAAVRAERVARRLLRRTRLLTGQAAQKLPAIPALDPTGAPEGHITLVLPEISPPAQDDERAREAAELRARAVRAEHAAAWLRARLRAERTRSLAPPAPHLDVTALTADLTRGLLTMHTPNPEAVRRLVQRTLVAHGLPVTAPGDAHVTRGTSALPWSREQQQALAAAVLARAPDVADRAYVERVLSVLAQRGRLTLPELTRATGLESAMARRRLRLAAEALTALGALTLRAGAYSLNPEWTPPRPDVKARGRPGRKSDPRR